MNLRFMHRTLLNAYSIIEASNSQPFSHIHLPGVAVGGHCIPVYPKFYMHTDSECTIPSAAVNLNESMPAKVVKITEEQYGPLQDARIAVLGLTYRGNVKETAFSGAFPLLKEITERGGTAVIHDPYF